MSVMSVYLMLVLGGNATPSAADVSTALSSVGVEADSERLNTLISELEGKDLNELLESGKDLLAKFGGGGGGGAAAAGGDAGGEAAKEEVKEEEEEVDMSGGMDMFGGDEGGGGDY